MEPDQEGATRREDVSDRRAWQDRRAPRGDAAAFARMLAARLSDFEALERDRERAEPETLETLGYVGSRRTMHDAEDG